MNEGGGTPLTSNKQQQLREVLRGQRSNKADSAREVLGCRKGSLTGFSNKSYAPPVRYPYLPTLTLPPHYVGSDAVVM